MPKIILIAPPHDPVLYRSGDHLGIKYLGAFMESHGYSCDVILATERQLDPLDLAEIVVKGNYDIVGFTLLTYIYMQPAIKCAQIIRMRAKKQPHIVVGGQFATFQSEEILEKFSQFDSVVRFEGEETFLELTQKVDDPASWKDIKGLTYREDGKIRVNEQRPLIEDLDTIPFPKRDITSRIRDEDHFGVATSRGCYMHCTFCSINAFYGRTNSDRWRLRSLENVMQELEYLHRELGATQISFVDDNFIGCDEEGRSRAQQIAEEIVRRDLRFSLFVNCHCNDVSRPLFAALKKAGMHYAYLGVESGVPTMLKRYGKTITVQMNEEAIALMKELDIIVVPLFIMFDPYVSFAELHEQLNFMDRVGFATQEIIQNKLDVYKGTATWNRLSKEGRLREKFPVYEYDFVHEGIGAAHQVLKDGLIDMIPADNHFLEARYDVRMEENRDELLVQEVDRLGERHAHDLVDIAKRSLRACEKDKKTINVDQLIGEFSAETQAVAAKNLKELRALVGDRIYLKRLGNRPDQG